MNEIADTAAALKTQFDSDAKKADEKLSDEVQSLIEQTCTKYNLAFFKNYDEWTFVDLVDHQSKKDSYEGNWYYKGYRGEHLGEKTPTDMKDDLRNVLELVARVWRSGRLKSVPNGISEKLRKNVEYRLSYFVNCP